LEIIDDNLKEKWILDYKKLFNEKYIIYIQYIYENIKNNLWDLKIYKIRFFPIERELHIVLDNNTILIFSLWKDLKNELERFFIFKNLRKKDFLESYYIDLRIDKRIFFCLKSNLNICKNNYKKIYNLKEKDLDFKKK
jgi:hypothetical protein